MVTIYFLCEIEVTATVEWRVLEEVRCSSECCVKLFYAPSAPSHEQLMSDRLTDEQQKVVDMALQGWNVRVRAVPGAGKTFTCLRLAAALEANGLRVLQITYSSTLKQEWREKRKDQRGMFIPHSFHSFARALHKHMQLTVSEPIKEDSLRKMISEPPCTLEKEYVADVIIVDETQDCCELYARLLEWYGRACGAKFQMVVVGQEDQAVFADGGKGGNNKVDERADLKYLLKDDAFGELLRSHEWIECPFTRSFRLTPSHARAINSLFEADITGCNQRDEDKKPIWICCNILDTRAVAQRVVDFLTQYGQLNTQLVAASWSEESNLASKSVRNYLSNMSFKFAPSNADAEIKRNKTIFYTCCGSKGTEARCTIILGADSFASYVNRPSKFVAMTRAREQLVVFQHYQNLPWMNNKPEDLRQHGFIVEMSKPFKPEQKPAQPQIPSVTDLLRSAGNLQRLMDAFCEWHVEQEPQHVSPVPQTVSFGEHSESLSRLLGVFIPFAFAVWNYDAAPRFDHIFEPIIVSTKEKGKAAIDEVELDMSMNGECLPNIRQLKHVIHTAVRKTSEQQIAEAIKNHLTHHGFENYANRIITKSNYERAFPVKKRYELNNIRVLPIAQWSPSDAAHAAMAADAFNGDHYVLRQLENYDWALEHIDIVQGSHELLSRSLNLLCPSEVKFEVSTTYSLDKAKDFSNAPYPIKGLAGRIDCVAHTSQGGTVLLEFKFSAELGADNRVQLFLYMCMWVARQEDPAAALISVTGILLNVRTGERLKAKFRPETPVASVIEAALDLHFDHSTTVDAVLARVLRSRKRPRV